jgi:signal peptidase
MLLINLILLTKSVMDPEAVPNVGGYLPLIVMTDSMEPGIQKGDLLICHTVDPEDVAVGDVIAFFQPGGNHTSVLTHRVIAIQREDGCFFQTRGDAKDSPDRRLVPGDCLVGVYCTRIPHAGGVAIFMQTGMGRGLCVALSLGLVWVLCGMPRIHRRRTHSGEGYLPLT